MASSLRPPFFLARASDELERRPAVIVVMEGKGLSQQLLRVCQRLAREGYTAIAPDLYHRFGGSDAETSTRESWRDALSPHEVQDDVDDCIRFVRGLGATSVAIVGFCMGGAFAYRAALATSELQAAVVFYGRVAGMLGAPVCPTRFFFGDRDVVIPDTEIEQIRRHHPGAVSIFRDAEHGFMRDGSENFHAEHAREAWSQMMSFLAEHLA